MSRTTTTIAALTAVAALALPAAASAHVTMNPNTSTAGAFTKLDVRVPNEQSNASTVKLQLQFPDGFAFASYEPRADWRVKVTRAKLAAPVQTDDGPITEGVKTITWTGSGSGLGRIVPDQFMEFPLSVQIPENAAGKTLVFKAIQTYSNGDVVRWIGAADSDHPAPHVTVAAASAGSGSGAAAPGPPAAPARPADGGGGDTIGVIALIVGGIGLVAAAAALAITRRPRRDGTAQAA
jgi:periplasmic copper chaperone A